MLSFVIFYFGLRVCVSKFQFPGRLDFRAGYDWVGVISSFEGTDFARLRKDAEISPITLEASIDLGKSMSTVLLDEEGLHLGDQSGAVLCNWDEIAKKSPRNAKVIKITLFYCCNKLETKAVSFSLIFFHSFLLHFFGSIVQRTTGLVFNQASAK